MTRGGSEPPPDVGSRADGYDALGVCGQQHRSVFVSVSGKWRLAGPDRTSGIECGCDADDSGILPTCPRTNNVLNDKTAVMKSAREVMPLFIGAGADGASASEGFFGGAGRFANARRRQFQRAMDAPRRWFRVGVLWC